jgi:hypothetical protein
MPYTPKRETIKIVVVIIAFVIALPILFLTLPKKGEVTVIDCTWSEISPDFTIQMREACRQARANNNQKDLQKPK